MKLLVFYPRVSNFLLPPALLLLLVIWDASEANSLSRNSSSFSVALISCIIGCYWMFYYSDYFGGELSSCLISFLILSWTNIAYYCWSISIFKALGFLPLFFGSWFKIWLVCSVKRARFWSVSTVSRGELYRHFLISLLLSI